MSIWDWIILGLIGAAVYLAVRRIRKKGGCCQGACGACGQCAHSESFTPGCEGESANRRRKGVPGSG